MAKDLMEFPFICRNKCAELGTQAEDNEEVGREETYGEIKKNQGNIVYSKLI